MTILIIALIAGLLPLAPAVIFALKRRRQAPVQATRKLMLGLGGFDIVVALMVVGLGLVLLFKPDVAYAAGLVQESETSVIDPYTPFAAALAVSVGSIGAAYAVSTTGSAAIGAIAEKPEVFGNALVFVGLAEGVAIYGLIIAFVIVTR
jgi:V/A-type H+-transporting ATPase subunit K